MTEELPENRRKPCGKYSVIRRCGNSMGSRSRDRENGLPVSVNKSVRRDHMLLTMLPAIVFEQQALKSGFTTVKRCNYAGLDFCFKFQKAKE